MMIDLTFDIRGNLVPYEKSELTFDEFASAFVDEIAEEGGRRREIFEDYSSYLQDFRREVAIEFIQWIDGSFISNKRNPRDIDFVTLLDYQVYETHEKLIEAKYRTFRAREFYGNVDAYFVKVYPKGHAKRFITEYDLAYWWSWFTETKKNRLKKQYNKGFVEIKFHE